MGRPKSYERADVLDRASRVFWTRGYEGTSVSDLVEATGLNRFSLYNEFGGKEGLYAAALEHYVAGLGDLAALLEREPLGLANVRAFHRAQLVDDRFQDGCFALNTVREKHVVPASAWSTIEGFTTGTRELLARNLRAAAAAGELPPGRDPEVLAALLAAFDMGLLSLRSLGVDRTQALRLVEEIERLLE
jgi:TetR/AcrR family transcriptional repressor of nem operon